MDLPSLFESFSIVVARQLGQKRKRRASQLRRRARKPALQALELRAMMTGDPYQDALDAASADAGQAMTDFYQVAATADAAWMTTETTDATAAQALEDAADATFTTTATTDDNALLAAVTGANTTEQAAMDSSDQSTATADQAAENAFSATVLTDQQTEASADATDQAAFNTAQAGAQSLLDSTTTADQASYDALAAGYQSATDSQIAANDNAYNATVAGNSAALQNTETTLQGALDSTVASAAAIRDSAIGGNGALFDTTIAASDPTYQGILQSATDTYNSQILGYASTRDNQIAQADSGYNDAAQVAQNNLTSAENANQAADDAAIQAAVGAYNTSSAQAWSTYSDEVSQHASTYAGKVQDATDQYNLDIQTANDAFNLAVTNANNAYLTSAQPVYDAYNSQCQTLSNQYATDSTDLAAQFETDKQAAQHTLDVNSAPAAAMQAASVLAATNVYNGKVANYQQTQATDDENAMSAAAESLVEPGHTLQLAEDNYEALIAALTYNAAQPDGGPFDQAAADAGLAALNQAKKTFAIAVAVAAQSAQATIGDDAVAFETSEEAAYVIEQDGFAAAQSLYNTTVAPIAQVYADKIADLSADYEKDGANLLATYENAIAAKYAAILPQVTAFDKTREDAIGLAQKNFGDAYAEALTTQDKAIADATQQQSDDDAASGKTLDDKLTAASVIEANAEAVANQNLVHLDGLADVAENDAIVQAQAAKETADAAAEGDYENSCAAADLQWITAVADAQASSIMSASGGDPTVAAVAQAWASYYIADVSAYGQFISADVAASESELASDLAALANDIHLDAVADAALADELVSAGVAQISSDGAAAIVFDNTVGAAEVSLINEEAAANRTDVANNATALSVEAVGLDLDGYNQVKDYTTAALAWIQSVSPAWLADVLGQDNAAAIEVDQVAHDEATFVHQMDAASVTEVGTLASDVQTTAHKLALVHQTYEIATAKLNRDAANDTADQNVATTTAADPSTFASMVVTGSSGGFGGGGTEPVGGYENVAVESLLGFVQGYNDGKEMVVNAFTLHQIPGLNDRVQAKVELYGGLYRVANGAAHVSAFAGYTAGGGALLNVGAGVISTVAASGGGGGALLALPGGGSLLVTAAAAPAAVQTITVAQGVAIAGELTLVYAVGPGGGGGDETTAELLAKSNALKEEYARLQQMLQEATEQKAAGRIEELGVAMGKLRAAMSALWPKF